MLAIGIRYLCGWSMATHAADRERPEWPPHPDRVFMALAAAHFETDSGPDERAALGLLSSSLSSPSLNVSGHSRRETVTSFVPVNDESSPIGKKGVAITPSGSMAIGRDRQPRSFPVAIPSRDTVFLIWPDLDVNEALRSALGALCLKVSAVGHSASLVQMWVEDNPPQPNLVPTEHPGAPLRLRVPWLGRFEELQTRYQSGLRPIASSWKGYTEPASQTPSPRSQGTVFSPDLVVLRRLENSRPLGLETTLLLAEALRGAAMKHCPDPPPEWVSGHAGANGPPSRKPHLAYVPLAHVGRQHADGHLLGVAIAVPRGISAGEQQECLSALLFDANGMPRAIRLTFGKVGAWNVAADDREDRPWTLRSEAWTAGGVVGAADTWGTVTPIVLDRYPKDRTPGQRANRVEEIIAESCNRILGSDPAGQSVSVRKVVATPAPVFAGVPHARDFPPLCAGPKAARRFHTHALIVFSEPVIGPVLVGAGRYRGYGLCRPLREEA
jgi:CRISPR-associated protein Csb2